MRRRVLTSVVALGLCLGAPTVSSAMDLRDMPQWVRDMIEPVEVEWSKLAPFGLEASVAPGARVDAPGVATGVGGEGAVIRAPDLGAVEGVHLPAMGGAMPGPVEVRAPGATGLAELEGVHVGDAAEDRTKVLADIEGLDHDTLAKAGQVVTMIREQNMKPDQFVEWAQENGIGPEAMTAGIAIATDLRTSPPFTE